MAQTTPGGIKATAPGRHHQSSRKTSTRFFATSTSIVKPGLTLWQHPRFFGYFPSNGLLASVLGDLVSTGPRRDRTRLAIESGADRSRRGHHRLAAADAGPVDRVERRHSGHGIDQLAGRALCARASGPRATDSAEVVCRPRPRRSLCTSRRRVTARSRRRRCWLASGASTSVSCHTTTSSRCAPTRSKRWSRQISSRGFQPCVVVATCGTTTSTAFDPLDAIGGRREASWSVDAR